jgi:anti-anti-sigma factor
MTMTNSIPIASDSDGSRDLSRWSVVVPPEEIDLALREHLESLIDNGWAPGSHLAIDLSGVTFMDSTALHWLLATRERALQANRELHLIVPEDGRVRWLLALVGIEKLFSIRHSLDQELA